MQICGNCGRKFLMKSYLKAHKCEEPVKEVKPKKAKKEPIKEVVKEIGPEEIELKEDE